MNDINFFLSFISLLALLMMPALIDPSLLFYRHLHCLFLSGTVQDVHVAADDNSCADQHVDVWRLIPPQKIKGNDPEVGRVVDWSERRSLCKPERLCDGVLSCSRDGSNDSKERPVGPWHGLPRRDDEGKRDENHQQVRVDSNGKAVFCFCQATHENFVQRP